MKDFQYSGWGSCVSRDEELNKELSGYRLRSLGCLVVCAPLSLPTGVCILNNMFTLLLLHPLCCMELKLGLLKLPK